MMNPDTRPFWETLPLAEMTGDQWESLCDGCARCCLHKLQDRDSGRVYFTMVACRLLDRETCRCRDYRQRRVKVPECLILSADNIRAADWLPATCAYRKRLKGEPLDWWHPLISGDRESVHRAGVSVRGMTLPEEDVHPEDWPRMILDWGLPPENPSPV